MAEKSVVLRDLWALTLKFLKCIGCEHQRINSLMISPSQLKVAYQDDTPVTSGEVKVRHTFSRDPDGYTEEVHTIPPSGIVTLEFLPPLGEDVISLALEAQYMELTQWLGDITRAQSPSNAFLQATLITQNPEVVL